MLAMLVLLGVACMLAMITPVTRSIVRWDGVRHVDIRCETDSRKQLSQTVIHSIPENGTLRWFQKLRARSQSSYSVLFHGARGMQAMVAAGCVDDPCTTS